mgnify:CR=1 FL=1
MIYRRLNRFAKAYRMLDDSIKDTVKTKLRLMAQNPFHPSLRTKKVQGKNGIFEASVNKNIRITWQYGKGGILLRNIGEHDETLKNP